jgi:hypothetical protein
VNIRGKLQRDDIYFNQIDLECLFGVSFSDKNNIVFINTEIGQLKYLTYNELINQFKLQRHAKSRRVFDFISLINTILDDEIDKINYSNHNYERICSDTESLKSDYSLIEDYTIDNKYMTMAYQYKIELLNQKLETKIIELQVKDRDIIILKMQMDIELNKKNKIIEQLENEMITDDTDSEWV